MPHAAHVQLLRTVVQLYYNTDYRQNFLILCSVDSVTGYSPAKLECSREIKGKAAYSNQEGAEIDDI